MGQDIIINNPSNNMKYNNNYLSLNDEKHNIDIVKNINDEEEEIYEDNYFTRSPRIINRIKKEVVKIAAPPQIESKEEAPMMLVLGSTLSMGAMILIRLSRRARIQRHRLLHPRMAPSFRGHSHLRGDGCFRNHGAGCRVQRTLAFRGSNRRFYFHP